MARKRDVPLFPVFLLMEDAGRQTTLESELRSHGWTIFSFQTGADFFLVKRNFRHGLVIAEFRLRDIHGLELLDSLRKSSGRFPLILIADASDAPMLSQVFGHVLTSPVTASQLIGVANKLLK